MRALIVDDSKFIREYVHEMLEPMNVPAMNGPDCGEAMRESWLHGGCG